VHRVPVQGLLHISARGNHRGSRNRHPKIERNSAISSTTMLSVSQSLLSFVPDAKSFFAASSRALHWVTRGPEPAHAS